MEPNLYQHENNDLSYWEFINSSDAEDQNNDDDDYDFEDSLYDGFGSWSSFSSKQDESEEISIREIESQEHVESPIIEEIEENMKDNCDECDVDEDEVAEDDDEDEEEFDLDDELVPWSVSDRFGRNRMRKLGKRSYAKMTKAKSLANVYSRRGCVNGKHGLGLKHCF